MINLICESTETTTLILGMPTTVFVALISAAVSIIVGMLTFAVSVSTAKKANLNFYSSTVSKERVDWINKTRIIASDLIAFCAVHPKDKLSSEDLYRFEKLRSSMLLRLSSKRSIEENSQYKSTDGKLVELLDKTYPEVLDNICLIREIVTEICKNEWDRVKCEAGGDKNIEKKMRKYNNSAAKERQKQAKKDADKQKKTQK